MTRETCKRMNYIMRRSVKSNYIYNLVYHILVIILPLITTPYISRVLNPAGIGAINYTSSVVSVAVLICSLGSGMYAQKEIAYAGENILARSKIFWSVFAIRGVSSLMVCVGYSFICFLSPEYSVIYLIQYITILANMFDVVWLFQGMEDFEKTSVRNIVLKIFSVIAIFLFVRNQKDVPIYVMINAVSSLASALVLWMYLPKFIVCTKIQWADIKPHIYPIVTLFIPMIAIYVYTYIDKIILCLLSSEAQVGFYSNAERIVKLPMTVITSLGSVMLPRVASLIRDNKWDKVRKDMRNSIHFVFFLGFPMAVGIAAIAEFFVPWFLGPGYETCIPLMRTLSVIIVIIGLSSVTGQAALVPLNKKKIYTISILLGAGTNLCLNIILIPQWGAQGAVIGTIAAESIVGIIQWVAVLKGIELKVWDVVRDNVKPFVGSLIMLLLLISIRPMFKANIIYTIVYGMVGVVTYFAVMVISKDYMIEIVFDYLKKIILRRPQ